MAQGGVGPVDDASLRKARGAFFTPALVSDFLASWAIRSETDRVLEPSCGEASFLLAAAARLRKLKSQTSLFDLQRVLSGNRQLGLRFTRHADPDAMARAATALFRAVGPARPNLRGRGGSDRVSSPVD